MPNSLVDLPRNYFTDLQATPETSVGLGADVAIEPTLAQAADICPFQPQEDSERSKTVNILETARTDSNSLICFDPSFPAEDDLGNVTLTEFWQLPAMVSQRSTS